MSATFSTRNSAADLVDLPRDPVIRPREAAAYTGLSESRLAKLRMTGDGPRFVKLSTTRVGYRHSALEEWLRERERTSTLEDKCEVRL